MFDPNLLRLHTQAPVAWTAVFTLAPMMALGVWGRGLARLLGVLAGIVFGNVMAIPLGQLSPEVRMPGLRWDAGLLAPFLVAGRPSVALW